MMRKSLLFLSLATLTVLASAGNVIAQVRYASERSPHKFAGATRVVLENFDPMDKDAKTASLHLDSNDVVFSAFGDQRITTVFYKPFQVKFTRLNGADPDGKDRGIFAVELPKEYMAALGASTLRLVAHVGAKSQPKEMRLLLVNSKGQVTSTLELRPEGSAVKTSPSSD